MRFAASVGMDLAAILLAVFLWMSISGLYGYVSSMVD